MIAVIHHLAATALPYSILCLPGRYRVLRRSIGFRFIFPRWFGIAIHLPAFAAGHCIVLFLCWYPRVTLCACRFPWFRFWWTCH